jgi:hypothetical protein
VDAAPGMESNHFDSWLAAYGRAWERRDAQAFAALFTPDVRYHWTPFEEPRVGRDAVAEAFERPLSGKETSDSRPRRCPEAIRVASLTGNAHSSEQVRSTRFGWTACSWSSSLTADCAGYSGNGGIRTRASLDVRFSEARTQREVAV